MEQQEEAGTCGLGLVPYVLQLRGQLMVLAQWAKKHLQGGRAQALQKWAYEQWVYMQVFKPGNRVLVLQPANSSRLLAQCQGPFEVVRLVGEG